MSLRYIHDCCAPDVQDGYRPYLTLFQKRSLQPAVFKRGKSSRLPQFNRQKDKLMQ